MMLLMTDYSKLNQRGSGLITVLIIVVIVVIVSGVALWYLRSDSSDQVNNIASPSPSDSISNSDPDKKYSFAGSGLSFSAPAEYTVTETIENEISPFDETQRIVCYRYAIKQDNVDLLGIDSPCVGGGAAVSFSKDELTDIKLINSRYHIYRAEKVEDQQIHYFSIYGDDMNEYTASIFKANDKTYRLGLGNPELDAKTLSALDKIVASINFE